MTWASLLWWKRERLLQHSQLPHTAINGVSCFSFIIICRLRLVRKLHTRSDCHTLTWLWISAKPTSPSTWRIRITARGFLLLSAECSCTYKNFINTSLFFFFVCSGSVNAFCMSPSITIHDMLPSCNLRWCQFITLVARGKKNIGVYTPPVYMFIVVVVLYAFNRIIQMPFRSPRLGLSWLLMQRTNVL